MKPYRTGPRGQTTLAREYLKEVEHDSTLEQEILRQAIASAKSGAVSLRAAVSHAAKQVPQDFRETSSRHGSKGVRLRRG